MCNDSISRKQLTSHQLNMKNASKQPKHASKDDDVNKMNKTACKEI